MNPLKHHGYRVDNKYRRFLSNHGYRDIWARELLNGYFEIDDMNCFGKKTRSIEEVLND